MYFRNQTNVSSKLIYLGGKLLNKEIEKSNKQEEFIRLFNGLHKFLQNELYEDFMKTRRGKESDYNLMTFDECLYTIKQKYKRTTLNNYIDQLYLIKNFRNTIVHESTNKFYNIAEPSDYTMEILKEVYSFFLHPIPIKKYLDNKRVDNPLTVSSDHNLLQILNLISKYNFSQFPVFDKDKFSGMITDNGLINFIAKLKDEEGIIFEEKTVQTILKDGNKYEENKDAYMILHQGQELYRVLDLFTDVENVIKYVLISKSGKGKFRSKEDLVGIFTAADISDVLNYLKEN